MTVGVPPKTKSGTTSTGTSDHRAPATGAAEDRHPRHRHRSPTTGTHPRPAPDQDPRPQERPKAAPPPTHSHASGGVPVVQPTTPAAQPAPTTAPTTTPAHPVTTLSPSAPGVSVPKGWTGTVNADPALTGAVNNLSGLLSNGNRPPSFLIPIYMEAGKKYGVPWEVLAAINAIETDYGQNLNTSSAGAVGWMQFEPSTWAKYGVAVDGHSEPNPYDPRDAIFAAAKYLAAAGAQEDVAKAVYSYNHASWYVDEVMARAHAIATHPAIPAPDRQARDVLGQLHHRRQDDPGRPLLQRGPLALRPPHRRRQHGQRRRLPLRLRRRSRAALGVRAL